MLAVVEHDQQLAASEVALEEAESRGLLPLELRRSHAQRLGDGLRDARRVAERRQLDEPDAVQVRLCGLARDLERKARLSDAARAGQRHEPMLGHVAEHQRAVVLAADEAREPSADVRPQRCGRGQLGCPLQHLPLERSGLLVRLETELAQALGKCPVDRERIRIASASVQRQHQEPCDRLAHRVLLDEQLQVGKGFVVPSELEERPESQLARLELELLQPAVLRLRELELLERAVRLSPPQLERLLRLCE